MTETMTPPPSAAGAGDASGSPEPRPVRVILAEFETVDEILSAARRVRDAGYVKWDCHTPFPVHGLDEAMGIRRTILPWLVMGAGTTGFWLAYLMQWWMNAVSYPLIISGKPMNSIPADIPVMFEVTVLFSALTAVGGLIALCGLPRFWHPVFHSDRFRTATQNRFFISIESSDPKFDADGTADFLRSLEPSHCEEVRV